VPFPNPDTQFKPGQSGNPGGHSSGRRLASAIIRLLDEKGLDRDVALTLIAKALGRLDILDSKIPDGKGGFRVEKRTPDFAWFKQLMDVVDGPLGYRSDAPPTSVPTDEPKRIEIPDADERLAPRED
jgi:hypothetical protein